MSKFILFTAIVTILISSCIDENKIKDITAEENYVFETVMSKFLEKSENESTNRKYIFLLDSTTLNLLPPAGHDSWTVKNETNSIKVMFPDISSSLFNDFEIKNNHQSKIHTFKSHVNFKIFSTDTLATIRSRYNMFSYLRDNYPSFLCIMRFSRVGFDAERKHAIVYMDYLYSGLNGAGNYILLANKSGIWTVESWQEVWIA